MAQLVARLVRNEKARGSNPRSSTQEAPPDLQKHRRSRGASSRHGTGFSSRVPPVCPRVFKRSSPARSADVPRWCR